MFYNHIWCHVYNNKNCTCSNVLFLLINCFAKLHKIVHVSFPKFYLILNCDQSFSSFLCRFIKKSINLISPPERYLQYLCTPPPHFKKNLFSLDNVLINTSVANIILFIVQKYHNSAMFLKITYSKMRRSIFFENNTSYSNYSSKTLTTEESEQLCLGFFVFWFVWLFFLFWNEKIHSLIRYLSYTTQSFIIFCTIFITSSWGANMKDINEHGIKSVWTESI